MKLNSTRFIITILLSVLLGMPIEAKPKKKKKRNKAVASEVIPTVALRELNLGTVPGGSMASEVFNLPGAKIGDFIVVVPLGSAAGATIFYGYVPNPDSVRVVVLPQATFNFMDFQVLIHQQAPIYSYSGGITQLYADETDWEYSRGEYSVYVPEDDWNNPAILVGPLFPVGIKLLWNPATPNFKVELVKLVNALAL